MKIAILGGGPGGLFMFKRLVESGLQDLQVDIFEKRALLGAGMPYSAAGANEEHITNVSGNEIPEIVIPIAEWIKSVPAATLERFHSNERFNDYKVLPRLLFGQYLSAQFDLLIEKAKEAGIVYQIQLNSLVTDIIDHGGRVEVEIAGDSRFAYDVVIICTGHHWPVKHEGTVPGYFDSPYPPSKLALQLNHPVAIKGSSLTAVDAIRTLARHHGRFSRDDENTTFKLNPEHPEFKMVLHTRNGMLPAVRFHLEDSHLENDQLLSPEEIAAHIADNDGFLSLDFVFEKDFKEIFRDKEPGFYQHVQAMSLEEFVADMMTLRERLDPFQLLKAEYLEAERSIKKKESVYWKEMLGVLSFAMNYPAKHLSAEDMLRLQKVLLPLISIVIAYIPQSSTEELLALHQAGVLAIIPVGDDSKVEAQATGGAVYQYDDQAVFFQTYVDCVGQPHLNYQDFPFKSLLAEQKISPALLKFKSDEEAKNALAAGKAVERDSLGNYYLRVSGITINDSFQVVDPYGAYNERIYIMAVPYIGGYNPDYSGLDFCEKASDVIIKNIVKGHVR
jgi:2-polyprenyl-6-methoxyphenol hydroxylase-like FAD-dependent oxidoreductase